MSFAATAIGVGAAAGIAGSMISAEGAREQAGAIVNGQLVGRQTALELDEKARQDMAPFRSLGLTAGNQIEQIIAGNAKLDDLFKGSSLYDWQSEMGTRGINRQLKARGLYNSGAGLETLAMFEKGLVAEEGAKWWDKLFNTTALGSNAAAKMATGTTQTGNTLASLATQSGIAQGGAIANQYNALAGGMQGIGQAAGQYAQYKMYQPYLEKLSSGSSGGSSPARSRDPLFDAVDSGGLGTF
jgi:hypothetical protein